MSNQLIKTKTGYVILCNYKEYQEFKNVTDESLFALAKHLRLNGSELGDVLIDQLQALWFLINKGLFKISLSEPVYEKTFLFLEAIQNVQSTDLIREMSAQEWQSYLSLLTQAEKLH